MFKCKLLCVYKYKLSRQLPTHLRKLPVRYAKPVTVKPKRRKNPFRDSRVDSCSVTVFMASVDPGEVIGRLGLGAVSGADLSGSATAVGALSSRSRQLLPACVPRHVAHRLRAFRAALCDRPRQLSYP